jgi:beta-galactosidase
LNGWGFHRNKRRALHPLFPLLIIACALAATGAAQSPRHTFAAEGSEFKLDGKPFLIRSGEMHYERVPREYWRDRMKKLRALGLNTLTTYVSWNAHEPSQGRFDFSGNLDLGEFLRTAQEEGLWVLLRPGPYACAEWDLGGIPAWLLADEGVKLRSGDQKYLAAAARYLRKLGEVAGPFR